MLEILLFWALLFLAFTNTIADLWYWYRVIMLSSHRAVVAVEWYRCMLTASTLTLWVYIYYHYLSGGAPWCE